MILFGSVAKKGRFFSGSAAGITPYHQVVEKLSSSTTESVPARSFIDGCRFNGGKFKGTTRRKEELLADCRGSSASQSVQIIPAGPPAGFFSRVTADETPALLTALCYLI